MPRALWRRRRLHLVSIQVTIAKRSGSRLSQRLVFRTFFCSRLKKDSIEALSPAAATRPIEPCSPLFLSSRITFLERDCEPLSECRIVPSGLRSRIALRIAEAAGDDFMRSSIE